MVTLPIDKIPSQHKINRLTRRPIMGKIDRWICAICEYVYDPINGDPDNGILPWTAFTELSDSWTCPGCGMGKEQFVPFPEYAGFDVSEDIEA